MMPPVSCWVVTDGTIGMVNQALGFAEAMGLEPELKTFRARGPWKYLGHKGSGGNRYKVSRQLEKYVIEDAAPDAPGQLYNLDTDPGETDNLYFKHPEIVKELKSQLEQCKGSGRSAPLRN